MSVIEWFAGKARVRAEEALTIVAECEREGCWRPGVSRKVRAALNKPTAAQKYASENGWKIMNLEAGERGSRPPAWVATHCMKYGLYDRIQQVDFAALRKAAKRDKDTPGVLEVVETAERYAKDHAVLSRTLAALDATRLKPVFTTLGASPTITTTLESMGLRNTVGATVRYCPAHWERRAFTVNGKVEWAMVMILDWPKGTIHGASRFSQHNDQCEACGHGIRTNNWIPLVIDDAEGQPYAVWTGRDCSETLFGIRVRGPVHVDRPAR